MARAKVLVVDDDGTSQLIMKRMVEEMGYNCDVASNGEEAVAAAGRKSYQVIMMDMFMPILNGCDAALSISKKNQTHLPAIVGMVSIDDPDSRRRCLHAGMQVVLCKPIQKMHLMQCLENITTNSFCRIANAVLETRSDPRSRRQQLLRPSATTTASCARRSPQTHPSVRREPSPAWASPSTSAQLRRRASESTAMPSSPCALRRRSFTSLPRQ